MGWYDPRGFVGGAEFLKNGDKAKILGLNAAKLLKITGRLGSMDIPVTKAAKRPKSQQDPDEGDDPWRFL
jgi:hypothetical protein